MQWIQGDFFKSIADCTYSPDVKFGEDYDNLPNTFDTRRLPNVNLVYTHTTYVKNLFDVLRKLPQEFVVITHNSDLNVTSEYVVPPNVRKWFTTNVAVSDAKISSIPIGLENDRWYPGLKKKEKMFDKMGEDRMYKNLVYMNHNIRNNISERTKPYEVFLNQSFCTTRMGTNGQDFDDYLDNLYNHTFVVCPQGNGMDTHRFWEALYMGTIPIVKKDLNNRFYEELPVCFVDEWDQCTRNFLLHEWARIQPKQDIYWLRMLDFEYWKTQILSA